AARLAVGVVQQRERLLLGELAHFAAERHFELQIGHDLIEQAAPCRAAGVVALGEHALLGLGEHVRAVAAQAREEVPPPGEPRRAQQRFHVLRVRGEPLELEEQQRIADLGAALLYVLEQSAVARRLRVGGEQQARERSRARRRLLQRLELVDGARELL